MANKYVNPNAKKALQEMKLEIANELGVEANNKYGSNNTSYSNGQLGGSQGLCSPWNSPGKNTGVSSHSLLQGLFPTQGLNPGLSHCRRILYQLSHRKPD